jgi:isoleucyl-tRNA synthetase
MTEQEENPQVKDLAPAPNPHVKIEEDILDFWDQAKIFEKSLEKNKGKNPYVFFDGPPFATGTPHYGHILGSTIKDAVPRYWTMKGYFVRRRWGWDCHGLPIEQLVEVKLGISGKKQIESIGIDKFNQICRENVLNYVSEWGKTVRRIARFVEFENSYKTMDSTYMESVWWAIKQIWDKQLIYEGRKVLLYCPRCETPVSNFEVAMDNSYDNVTEDAVYVKALLKDSQKFNAAAEAGNSSHSAPEKISVLFWTTTPWTLPGNVALAVGRDIDYALVRSKEEQHKGQLFILAHSKIEILLNNPEILKVFKGSELVGMEYEPIFNLPALASENSFKIYDADFVTTEDGTGIVHTAVVYGEEDYALGQKVGLPVVPLITPQGMFNELVPEFLRGKFYKKTEPEIIAKLEENGQLFKKEAYSHSVPFCWRCGTRLFYNAIPSWFVNIQKIKPRLLELNQQQINWYPAHLKNGRFAMGIENAPDWNISRNRYWATALPFWKCSNKACSRTLCIGSLSELREKALNYDEIYKSEKIAEVDLHRPQIDQIKLQCPVCANEMQRVPEVVDSWVEAASMPFAEFHYPFENEEQFKNRFPAQFVSEYLPQTRAWFYVMHVFSTIIFDKAPFENVVTTGIVQAEDGHKMSKSKKNYPDPWHVMNKYGVDALRYYLLSSPVMQSENMNFSERELDDVYKKIIIVTSNVHSFLRMYSQQKFEEGGIFARSQNIGKAQAADGLGATSAGANILDQWILALLHQMQVEVTQNMENYDTVRAVRPIQKFINELSTWYLRRSRERIKESGEDSKMALNTLAHVLIELSKVMAPFTPFISEHIYKDLTGKESVHLADWNMQQASKELSQEEIDLLSKMEIVREIVELGLSARKEANIKVRQPLEYLAYKFKVVASPEKAAQSQSQAQEALNLDLEKLISQELNVKEIHYSFELSELPESKLKESTNAAVLLSIKISAGLREEGMARELERQVQDLRKKFGLKVGEMVDLYYETKDYELETALISKFDRKKTFVSMVKKEVEVEPDEETQVQIEGKPIWLGIVKM